MKMCTSVLRQVPCSRFGDFFHHLKCLSFNEKRKKTNRRKITIDRGRAFRTVTRAVLTFLFQCVNVLLFGFDSLQIR